MSRKENRLFTLLVKNYLLFTLTLLAIAGGVYWLWDCRFERLLYPVDWDALADDPRLARGEYAGLEDYLQGAGNGFAVLDENGAVLYRAGEGELELTPGELDCVALYRGEEYLEAFPEKDAEGTVRYRVLRTRMTGDGMQITGNMALDGELRVVSGALTPGKTAYTPREYGILAGTWPTDGQLFRQPFTAADGTARTLLLCVAPLDDAAIARASQNGWQVWLAALPLYGLALAFFIWRVGRRIRPPLDRLQAAVDAQAQGRTIPVGDCGGVQELQRIGRSFDELTRLLAASEREREHLDRERQRMIANISHDLKTPVTVIAGYVDALADGKVPPGEQGRYLAAIRSRTQALTGLINAFHEYSKVDHPQFALQCQTVDLCEFLREYLAAQYDAIALAGFELEVSIPEVPCLCRLDPFQMGRALDNLLGNALRYNRLGTVLSVTLAPAGRQALLTVADNGEGIPPDRADTIFDPFVVGSDARSGGGSGLGLSITRRLVELHGGTITLRSEPHQGAVFEISLPLETQ